MWFSPGVVEGNGTVLRAEFVQAYRVVISDAQTTIVVMILDRMTQNLLQLYNSSENIDVEVAGR